TLLQSITIKSSALCTLKRVLRLARTCFATQCHECESENAMTFQPRGIGDQTTSSTGSYLSQIEAAEALLKDKPTWNGVTAEAVARMRLQNRFKTGLDIARYTAALMRADMAAYDADSTKYTQSLGCWHGFVAQQKLISI